MQSLSLAWASALPQAQLGIRMVHMHSCFVIRVSVGFPGGRAPMGRDTRASSCCSSSSNTPRSASSS